jgi:hypothetical protein
MLLVPLMNQLETLSNSAVFKGFSNGSRFAIFLFRYNFAAIFFFSILGLSIAA